MHSTASPWLNRLSDEEAYAFRGSSHRERARSPRLTAVLPLPQWSKSPSVTMSPRSSSHCRLHSPRSASE